MNYNVDDKRRWDELFASVPPEWKDAPPSEAMKVCLRFFQSNRALSILDVGCGVGRWAVYLAKNGLRVKGFDFSENAIEFANAWAANEGLDIEFSCNAIAETAFPGERFDAVVAALVLDCVSNDEMKVAVSQIHSSLVEGGGFFAVFNPQMTEEMKQNEIESGNPTAGITGVSYTDEELLRSFPGFQIISFERFELGTRGMYLLKHTK